MALVLRLLAAWLLGGVLVGLIVVALRTVAEAPLPVSLVLGGLMLVGLASVVAGTVHFSADILAGRYPPPAGTAADGRGLDHSRAEAAGITGDGALR